MTRAIEKAWSAMGVSLPSRRRDAGPERARGAPWLSVGHRTDNGPEFTAQLLVDSCGEHGCRDALLQPGKPDQNAYIERFNRSYRTEVLNAYLTNP